MMTGRLFYGKLIVRRIPLTFRGIVLALALIVLIFSNDETGSLFYQGAGVSLLGASAIICLFTGKVRLQHLTMFDALFFVMVAFSLVATLVEQQPYTLFYTVVFLATYCSIIVIVRTMTDDEIMFTFLVAVAASLLILVVAEGRLMAISLKPGAWNRWELRFTPFGLHPDLTGYAYGGFVILMLFARFPAFALARPLNLLRLGCAAFAFLVVLAASARGGLLAVVVTISLYVARNVAFNPRMRIYLILGGLALAGGLIVYWDHFARYMVEILELHSNTRGIGSGGSGRVELWVRGLGVIADRSWDMFIGSGLRSSAPSQLGFSTESSYITIVIENGLIGAGALVAMLLWLLLKTGKGEMRRKDVFDRMTFYCVVFAMSQSIFNRYLIAIGNPFSLMFLIMVSRVFLNYAQRRRAAHAAQRRMQPARPAAVQSPAPVGAQPALQHQAQRI